MATSRALLALMSRIGRKRAKASVITLADRARDARQWELAAGLYRKALVRNPRNPPILVQYGHVLKESGNLAKAEDAYRTAIAYDPGDGDARLQLGHVLKLQGKVDEAQGSYLRAFSLAPSMRYGLYELRGLGWSEARLVELERLLAGEPLPVGGSQSSGGEKDLQSANGRNLSERFDPEFYLRHYPDVAHAGMDPLEHFSKYGWREGRKPFPITPAVTDAKIFCLKAPSFSDEVALFVTHSMDRELKPHVPHYLGSLKRQHIAVVLIIAVDKQFTAADDNLTNETDGLFIRSNEGYDFAAWAHVLRLHPELFEAKILYLLNDSLIGPTNDAAFAHLLGRLRDNPADLIGLTENFDRAWHIQSYFLALKPRALSSNALRKFINDIVSHNDKDEVINNYEVRFASILQAAGLNCDVIFRTSGSVDPTIYHWKSLLQSGFPFIKIKTLRDVFPGVDISDWRQLLAALGYDVSLAERSLEESGSSVDEKLEFRERASLDLSAFFEKRERLRLPCTKEPLVSILLVLYNQAALTLRCLRALVDTIDMPAEIIIVDNASSDDTGRLLDYVKGARIVRNTDNLHFLHAVNQAAALARGEALLLLNNDATLMPGALQAAIETLHSAADVGAVGGKLILPDGTLQEAGSIIWNDGTCAGYGRGQNPAASEYQFRREVDYCSAAFLLVRRDVFQLLGQLDTTFAPAYYEETDLCMRLRRAGYRTMYDPRAEVLHFEFASSSSSEQALSLMRRNHKYFCDRHWRTLAKRHLPPNSSILLARTPDRRRSRLLVIDDLVPFPSHGAGFPRASRILKALYRAGYFVTYYPVNQPVAVWKEVYTVFPREIEFILGHSRRALSEFLNDRTGYYDIFMVCRPNNMELFVKHFDAHPDQFRGASIVYDAEALFCAREALRQAVAGAPLTAEVKEMQLLKETDLARAADAVITVNSNEASVFKAAGHCNVHVVGHALEPAPIDADFGDRRDFLFVGPLQDDYVPNTDALFWFIEQVMPYLNRLLHDSYRVYVAGVCDAPRLRNLIDPRIVMLGRVEDLTQQYKAARVFIAPTRFSAGIPHKIHETAARGLPAVATSLLATQVGWKNGVELLVADPPEDFAAQCARLYTDRALWYRLREAALLRVAADCDPADFERRIAVALRSVGASPGTADALAGCVAP